MAKRSKASGEGGYARGAGILMHLTSLPGRFGVGDAGPEAYRFADFLADAKQSYWQLLPLNPVDASQAYSPYSSYSSMAGNTLLISPDLLMKDGLISSGELRRASSSGKVSFREAEEIKEAVLNVAFRKFQAKGTNNDFRRFTEREGFWLDDYSLYVLLKKIHGTGRWYEWPAPYRLKNAAAVRSLVKEHEETITRIKWEQYVFFKQWSDLKAYCNNLGISLIGDVPFYVGYESVDVWANQKIFSLDRSGKMKGVAGVPPDYFNSDGQLWGMPVFDWKELRKQKYAWWVQRMRRNAEMYDIVRLDHFRAFADFWQVPSGEKTARNGKWRPGPGNDLFFTLKKQLGELPFIAEDLGDINEPVLQLRDEFALPGMRVLQFAFGDNMTSSDYIPHNYIPNSIVYTGTHDNNTTVGWFRKDIGKVERENLSAYLGKKVHQKNVHLSLIALAYSSVSKIAIVPMQDVLGLDEKARMNTPASVKDNWLWRLGSGDIKRGLSRYLRGLAALYNR